MRRTDLKLLKVGISVVSVLVFVLITFNQQSLMGEEEPAFPEKKPPELEFPEEPVTEYLSNEILIKLKPQAKEELKNELQPATQDTGISTLDKINKDLGVVKMEKIAKEDKKSQKDHDVFRWYKITLPDEREIIKDEHYQKQDQGLPSIPTQEEFEAKAKTLKLKGIMAKYKEDPNIEAVELNSIVRIQTVPNDPYYSSFGSWGQGYDDLWGLKKIQAEQAWDISTGSHQVIVAVIDTGIDYNHPDIAQNIWVNEDEIPDNGIDDDNNGYIDDVRGWDYYYYDNDPMDNHGHGTHIAGTIGAVGNNAIGVVGVNWNVKIMAMKFLGPDGRGFPSDAATSIVYAVDNGARVLSNSWGGPNNLFIHDAVEYASNKGCVVIAAAGNSNSSYINSPANEPKVIAVSSTDHNDQKSDFSNYGPKIDIAAPGGDSANETYGSTYNYINILSLRSSQSRLSSIINVGDNFLRLRGTSMAAPHVSGLAALILSKDPDYTPEEVRQILRQSADKVSGQGPFNGILSSIPFHPDTGYGRINAYNALNFGSPPPVAKILSPRNDDIFGKDMTIEIKGTVSSRSATPVYEVWLGKGEFPEVTWLSIIGSSSGNISEGALATWNTPSLESGEYTIGVMVTDSATGKVAFDHIVITVDATIVSGWPIKILSPSPWSVIEAGYPTTADLDGDGMDEIIVGGTLYSLDFLFGLPRPKNKLFVFQRDGTPLPGWPKEVGPGAEWSQIHHLSFVDLDRDGEKEIVFLLSWFRHLGGARSEIYVFDKNGNVLPGWPKEMSWNISLAVGDVIGDGDLEIVFIGSSPYEVSIFSKDSELLSSYNVIMEYSALSDIDGDGKEEIIGAGYETISDGQPPEPNLIARNADGTFVPGWEFGSRPQARAFAVGNLDKKSNKKIVVTGLYKSNTVKVWDGASGEELFSFSVPGSFWRRYISLADVDGDGAAEIVVTNYYSIYFDMCPWQVTIWVYELDGVLLQGWPQVTYTALVGVVPITPVIGDFNNDGKADITVPDERGIAIFDSDGHKLLTKSYGKIDRYLVRPLVTDLDRDGKLEMFQSVWNPWEFFTEDMTLVLYDLDISSDYRFLTWNHENHNPQNDRALPFCSDEDLDHDGLNECQELDLGTDPNNPDTDGDGCKDGDEVNNPPQTGGSRNPLNPYDFYDVPVPAIGAGGSFNGVKDGAINLSDVLAVLYYVGASTPIKNLELVDGKYRCIDPNNQTYGYCNDLNNNGIADGAEYDRTPSANPENIYALGPPDGAITMSDVLVVLPQVGHYCHRPYPTLPLVTDEGKFTTSKDRLSASWVSQDEEYGITEYQYRLIAGSPTTVIRDWTSTGLNPSATATGLNLQEAKTYYFSVRAKNRVGLFSEVGYSDGITVDTTAPTGSILINNNAAYTNTSSVTLSLLAKDGSGLDQMIFSENGLIWSNPETYATSKNWYLPKGDGSKAVYVKFKDMAGNWSASYSDTIILDTTPPAITNITDSPDPFYTLRGQVSKISYTLGDNLSLTLNVSVELYNSNGTLVRTLGPNTQSLGANSITWDGKDSSGTYVYLGTYKYRIRAQDLAGNLTTSAYYYVSKR